MAKTTIRFGLLLIGLGVVGYLGASASPNPPAAAEESAANMTDATQTESEPKKKSVTALIPAFVGGILAMCGVIALNEGLRMHAMHGAVLVGLLGCLAGLGRGCMGIGKFLSGDPTLNQRSFLFVWLMAIICGIFVFLCVQSFIAARKKRQADEAATS